MKSIVFAIIAIVSISLSSCKKDKGMADSVLIEAIQNASNKQSIETDKLPNSCMTTLNRDYSDSYLSDAMLAPELGYEVMARRERGGRIGEQRIAYFDLKGRELRWENDGDKKGGWIWGNDKDDKGDFKCFDWVYPVTFIMPDQSVIDANNENEAVTAIKAWYIANPGSKDKPGIDYPVDIEFEDGSLLTMNNDEDLRGAYADCYDDKDFEQCFDFVYPITMIMPDGTLISGSDEDNLKDDIRAWYTANPNDKDWPAYQYPFNILFDKGTSATINSETELKSAYSGC